MWKGSIDTKAAIQGYAKVGLDSPRRDIEMTEMHTHTTAFDSDGSIESISSSSSSSPDYELRPKEKDQAKAKTREATEDEKGFDINRAKGFFYMVFSALMTTCMNLIIKYQSANT